MPTLKLRFPGGRYHATPWGHHVNEGLIEWPPSPWRLLRALIACGFVTQQWGDIPPLSRSLIDKLASESPKYTLPQVTAAHTRHFMPYISGKNQNTTLVWDTFANVGNGEDDYLLVHWPCELNSDETAMLAQLANHLNYLGRSESWVEVELIPDSQVDLNSFNSVPHQQGDQHDQKYEQISLMAPIPADSYRAWQQEKAKEAVAHLELPVGKKKPTARLLKDRDKELAPYPPDLVACLTKDTFWWKGHGWSQPPGSQRVPYWRPSQSMQVTAPPRRRIRRLPPVQMMLLALTTPSGNKTALPSITRTLPQAELLHAAIIRRAANGKQINCPELTGRNDNGDRLQLGHQHAHILPLDLDSDQRLDHVLIYAPQKLGDAAQSAIRGLKRTWTKGGGVDLQIAIAGCGELNDLRRLPEPLIQKIDALLGPRDTGCRNWTSMTPFVPPRYVKQPGKKNDLADQVNAELASRGLPSAEVTMLPWQHDDARQLRHFIRCRKRGGTPPPQDVGYALKLRLVEPIYGPLALGYGCHFGLGLFTVGEAS
jgi:CRISPR-associated protein Csb2